MFPVTIAITTVDELTKVMSALNLIQRVQVPTANEMVAEILNNEAAMADTKEPPAANEAPGKSAKADRAPGQRTATAGADAAPAKMDAEPAGSAPSAVEQPPASTAAADKALFDYTVLAKAVNSRITKFGKDALLAVAKKHGAETFKALPADKWEAAHADVVALGV